MYSLAVFYTTEIPGRWPYTGEVNLFTWIFDNLWLSLHVGVIEPANRITQSYTQKGQKKGLKGFMTISL